MLGGKFSGIDVEDGAEERFPSGSLEAEIEKENVDQRVSNFRSLVL